MELMLLDCSFYQIASEKDVQWSDQGMVSSYKFVQKLWTMHMDIKKISKKKGKFMIKLEKFTNQLFLNSLIILINLITM